MKTNLNFTLFALFSIATIQALGQSNPNVILPEGSYPYWPSYQHLDSKDLANIKAQEWKTGDNTIDGWDWSLPPHLKVSPRSSIGLQRNMGCKKDFIKFDLSFEANPVGLLWVKWRDIEPTMGSYNFAPIIDRIKQANSNGTKISLRILGHSKTRGSDLTDLSTGDAPLWLEDLGVNLLPQKKSNSNVNFDPAHPEFHKRYLMLINALAQTEIPKLVKAAYVGYASASLGDEGIGPFPETKSASNDTVKHVRERLDAWEKAFKGMETKVYMGGSCEYGFQKGFGTRRGFVEMYLYKIPNSEMGQYVDNNGYLSVDETASILKYKCINGEVNEEYEPHWITEAGGFRYGNTTNSFSYRYFTSNLRALQMQCTYLHTTGHLIPQMLPFMAQELGRTIEDTPDVWTFLRTSYLNAKSYEKNDWKKRAISATELTEGIETKNFERWLYQRDAAGYETQPDEKIQHSILMSAVQNNKNFDYIARSGKKIGFDIDDRWQGIKSEMAIKVTIIDKYAGELKLLYNNGHQQVVKSKLISGDGKLKTITFFVSNLKQNGMPKQFDFTLEAGAGKQNIVVSMVRVVQANELASLRQQSIKLGN